MGKLPLIILPTVAACLTGIGSLAADSLNLNSYQSGYNINFNGANETTGAGLMHGTLNGVSSVFFCYDLAHNINMNTNYAVNVVSPTTTNLNNLPSGYGFSNLPGGITNVQIATTLLNNVYSPSLTADQTSALQLSVWAILYDWNGSYQPSTFSAVNSASAGNFYITSASSNVQQWISTYLGNAAGINGNFSYGSWNLMLDPNSSNPYQSLIGMTLPEPQTYILMGSLLAVTAFLVPMKRKLAEQKIKK